jgi:hypothetical protein
MSVKESLGLSYRMTCSRVAEFFRGGIVCRVTDFEAVVHVEPRVAAERSDSLLHIVVNYAAVSENEKINVIQGLVDSASVRRLQGF